MNIRETVKTHPVAITVTATALAIAISTFAYKLVSIAPTTPLFDRYGFELVTRVPHEPGISFTAHFYRSTFPDTTRLIEYATAGPVKSDSSITFRDTIPYETRWYYGAKVDRLPFRSAALDRSAFSKLVSVLAVDFRQGQREARSITLYDSIGLLPPNLRKEMICVDVPCMQWAIVRAKTAHNETITGSCPYFDNRPPYCKTTLSDLVAIVGDLMHSPSLLVWFTQQYNRDSCDTFTVGVNGLSEAAPTILSPQLLYNFPNPFNAITRISYSIPTSGYVELKIYNVAGQEIRTLVFERQDAGYHELIWNGRDNADREVASGVYFLAMHLGSEILSRKMILLR